MFCPSDHYPRVFSGKFLTSFRKMMKQDMGVVSLDRLPLKMNWSCVPC